MDLGRAGLHPPDVRQPAGRGDRVPPGRADPLADDDVLVDAGVLTVEELSPPPAARLRVTTTKRVYFRRNFPGPGMSIFMCVAGYAAVAEDFVLTCAIDPTNQGSEFNPRPKKGTAPGTGPRPPLAPVIKEFADEVAATTKVCPDDLATMAQETADKIDKKLYGVDDLVQDAASIWVKTLRESAAAVELGVRSARVAGARARRPPED